MSDNSRNPFGNSEKYDSACLQTMFALTYDIGSERADALYRKAISNQWDIDKDIDWKQTIDPSSALTKLDKDSLLTQPIFSGLNSSQLSLFLSHYAIERLSQLLHGEQGAMLVAAQLVHSIPDRDGKLFAASQTMDEARHVDVFSRYIKRFHRVAPPCPVIKRILGKILQAPSWQAQLVGMQVIVEGLAMSNFLELSKEVSCPVLLPLLSGVMRDEARHIAFGRISLKETVADMPVDEREELEDFALSLVQDYRNLGRDQEDWMGLISAMVYSEIDPIDYLVRLKFRIEKGERLKFSPSMNQAMEKFIIPSLVGLDLIPERLKAEYVLSEIPLSGDMSLLEAIESQVLSEF